MLCRMHGAEIYFEQNLKFSDNRKTQMEYLENSPKNASSAWLVLDIVFENLKTDCPI